jgi:hypothetical protein
VPLIRAERSSATGTWPPTPNGDHRIVCGGFHTFARRIALVCRIAVVRRIDGRWGFIVDDESTDVDESTFEPACYVDDVTAFVS